MAGFTYFASSDRVHLKRNQFGCHKPAAPGNGRNGARGCLRRLGLAAGQLGLVRVASTSALDYDLGFICFSAFCDAIRSNLEHTSICGHKIGKRASDRHGRLCVLHFAKIARANRSHLAHLAVAWRFIYSPSRAR